MANKAKENVKRFIQNVSTEVANEVYEEDRTMRITVTNIQALTNEQCEKLECGDVVAKEDVTGKHAYIVSFKKAGTGMCITYTDATCVETVSYDCTDGDWVYNSTDKTTLTPDA